MDCPECGSDAGDARFCPECGNRITVPEGDGSDQAGEGICPECGAETGDAKFCPDCGHRQSDAPPAPAPARGQRQPAPRKQAARSAPPAESPSGKSRQERRQAERHAAHKSAARQAGPARPAAGGPRTSTWLIWGGFAAAAVVIVVLIVALTTGSGGGTASPTTAPVTPVASVPADTSGSYSDLVARANGLYDQGSAAFDNNDGAGGQKYFAAAAKVYAAAWKKQADDPNVGTDFATALFYSGDISAALDQVDAVIETSPDFQTAHLNRGIFLSTAAQDAKDAGDTATADKLLADAKAAFEKAVSIDPGSEPGKNAAQQLQQL